MRFSAKAIMRKEAGGLLLPALVIPEIDHLLGHRLWAQARRTFHSGLVEGDYAVIDLAYDQYDRVAALDRRFASLALGFVDAALAVLADVTMTRRIATTDRRHFEPLAAALGLELIPS